SQQSIRNLGVAFQRFATKKARHPKFKKRGRCKDSFYLANNTIHLSDSKKYIYVPKLSWVRMSEPLRFQGRILSATISRSADWWYASIQVELPDPAPTKPKGAPVGVDLGFQTF